MRLGPAVMCKEGVLVDTGLGLVWFEQVIQGGSFVLAAVLTGCLLRSEAALM